MTYTTPNGQTFANTVDLIYNATPDGVLIETQEGDSLWLNFEELDEAMSAVRREQYRLLCELRLAARD